MVKKDTKRVRLTVDEKKYEKLNLYNNNINQAFDKFLDIYLQSLPDTELQDLQIQANRIKHEINDKYEELAIVQMKINKSIQKLDLNALEKQQAWITIRKEISQRAYDKRYDYISEDIIKQVTQILGYKLEELIQIYNFIEIHYNDFNFAPENINKWEYVEKAWSEYK